MSNATCTKCGRPAFYFRAYTGERLCIKHFLESIEENVRRNIGKNKLFTWNDKIMVAASGGKDSSVLLYILHKIEQEFPHTELFALTIDEGVQGYTEQRAEIVRKVIKMAERDAGGRIEHYTASFKERYGYTLQEIVERSMKMGKGVSPCTYCGVLRRRLINVMAKELGATKVATGHNLDDEAQTILLNLGRGDIHRLARVGPKPIRELPGFVPRVKPLRYVPEEEIAVFSYLKGFPFMRSECRYIGTSMRGHLRVSLNRIDRLHPGFKYRIVQTFDQIQPILAEKSAHDVKVRPCKKCGEPTTGEICRACQLLEELGID